MRLPTITRFKRLHVLWLVVLIVSCLLSPLPMMALPREQSVRQVFDLPAGSAEVSLRRYSEKTGLDVLFATEITAGVKTRGVNGKFTRAQALSLMLDDSGLVAAYDEASGVFTIQSSTPTPMTPNVIKKIRHTLMGLLLSLTVSHQGNAQEASDPDQDSAQQSSAEEEVIKMNPYVVENVEESGYGYSKTALGTRTVQSVLDIPTSVAAVTREFLDDLNSSNIVAALDYGVSGVTNNTTVNDDVNIRGFRTWQMMRDGVMVVSFKRNPMFDVDRVEVIKGPSGMLLGNTFFLGGVVNYATKHPTTTRQTTVQTTVSSLDSSLRVEANSSGPIKKSKKFTALYRVTVGGEWGDPKKDVQDIDQNFIGGALTFKFFEDRMRLDLTGYYFVDNGYAYMEDFLDINRSVVGGRAYLNQYSTPEFSAIRKDQAYWDQSQEFLNATLTAQLTENSSIRFYYAKHKQVDRRDLFRPIALQSDNVTLDRQFLKFAVDNNSDALQLEYLYKTIKSSWRNDFQVGADAYFETYWQRNVPTMVESIDVSNPDYSFTKPVFNGFTHYSGKSVKHQGTYFVQDNLTVLDGKVIVIGGLRWVDSNSTHDNRVAGVVTSSNTPVIKTHRYGIVYKPVPNLSVYYVDAVNVTNIGGQDGYGNATSNQHGVLEEFGAKFELSYDDFSLSGSVAFFDMANTHVWYSFNDPILGPISLQDPTGDTSKGWETDIHINKKTSNGNAHVVFTYMDIETFRKSTGLRALGAPDTSFSVFGKYSWTSGPVEGLTLGGGFRDESLKLSGAYTVDIPMTFTIMGRYQINKRWSVQLNGENITDERFVVNVANPALAQGSLGANYRLSAKFTW